jgi:hypothetical protein
MANGCVDVGVGAVAVASNANAWMEEQKRSAELDRKRLEENARMVEAYGDGSSLKDLENAVEVYGKR